MVFADDPALGKGQDVGIEGAFVSLDLKKGLCIFDRRGNLGAMSDDVGICEKGVDLVLVEACDLDRVESLEGLAERLSFVEDAFPRETRLEDFENEQFEELPFVMHRHAPLLVMIGDVERIVQIAPMAAGTLHVSRRARRETSDGWRGMTRRGLKDHLESGDGFELFVEADHLIGVMEAH